jgi:hypothetical protein
LIGAIDTARYKGDLIWLQALDRTQYWLTRVSHLNIGKKRLALNIKKKMSMFWDTGILATIHFIGTSLVYAPECNFKIGLL